MNIRAIVTAALILAVMSAGAALAKDVDVVVIDPGHGGIDTGIVTGAVREKDAAMNVARQLEAQLVKKGKVVHLLRVSDVQVTIGERRAMTSMRKQSLFISLHQAPGEGFVIITAGYANAPVAAPDVKYRVEERQRAFTDASWTASGLFADALKAAGWGRVKRSVLPLPLLQTSESPAIMIEMPTRGVDYMGEGAAKVAGALVEGIMAYERQ